MSTTHISKCCVRSICAGGALLLLAALPSAALSDAIQDEASLVGYAFPPGFSSRRRTVR